jgi:hypothetical protein
MQVALLPCYITTAGTHSVGESHKADTSTPAEEPFATTHNKHELSGSNSSACFTSCLSAEYGVDASTAGM